MGKGHPRAELQQPLIAEPLLAQLTSPHLEATAATSNPFDDHQASIRLRVVRAHQTPAHHRLSKAQQACKD